MTDCSLSFTPGLPSVLNKMVSCHHCEANKIPFIFSEFTEIMKLTLSFYELESNILKPSSTDAKSVKCMSY